MGDLLSTLLVPTERSPRAIDVKRALLLFDQVHLMAVDDREPLPREMLVTVASPMTLPFAIDQGPALPLGKVSGYDASFEALLEECRPAIASGSLVLRSSPPPPVGMMIGSIPVPAGLAPPAWVLRAFRSLASKNEYLRAACVGIPKFEELRRQDLNVLAPGGAALDINFGNLPTVAALDDEALPADLRSSIRLLAAARLAAIVRAIGMCEVTGLHPFSTDVGVSMVLDRIQEEASRSLAAQLAADGEADVVRRGKRVERLLFEQLLPDVVLDSMSVSDVIRSRTVAWGRAGEHRAAFFSAVRRLSEDAGPDEEFDRAVRREIDTYMKAREGLAGEWKKFGLQAGVPLAGVIELADHGHLVEHLFGIASWDIAIMVSAAFALAGKIGPDVIKVWTQRKSLNVSAGKALMSPYAGVLGDRTR